MLISRKIKVGKKYIQALAMKLHNKNLVVLRGTNGYVMCGYLNLKVANKFKDIAVKIVGIATIKEALKADVYACSHSARKIGIHKGQHIKNVLKVIA
jgi:uncharacterized protein YunC (DUF1805 family)